VGYRKSQPKILSQSQIPAGPFFVTAVGRKGLEITIPNLNLPQLRTFRKLNRRIQNPDRHEINSSPMPLGLARYYGDNGLHFVTCSCYHRLPILNCPAACDLFLSLLEETRVELEFSVLGYVVMPEHFHLLASEPKRFSRALHRGSIDSARHVWQRRFYDFNVFSDKKLTEKIHYIHRNPLRRGLVDRPEDWKWSSFRFYASGESGPVRIHREQIVPYSASEG
jgi:putative transposase